VPTLTSLVNARQGWVPVSRSQLAGLVICETSDAASPTYLPQAANEVRMVRECFEAAEASVLNASSTRTSVSELRALLEDTHAHVLHLACHGIQDSNPLRSAIVLQDGKLTVEDIMRLSLPHAVLAFLSACQTAKGDKSAPDQAIHIAASMLFCGFKSVIGTMWYVCALLSARLDYSRMSFF
jgi:CHAT domain-containing protein